MALMLRVVKRRTRLQSSFSMAHASASSRWERWLQAQLRTEQFRPAAEIIRVC